MARGRSPAWVLVGRDECGQTRSSQKFAALRCAPFSIGVKRISEKNAPSRPFFSHSKMWFSETMERTTVNAVGEPISERHTQKQKNQLIIFIQADCLP